MIMSLVGGLTGNKGETKSTYSKGQQGIIDQIGKAVQGMSGQQDITQNQGYQQGQEWLNNLYNDPQFFNAFEAPLQRQFQEQTIPDLANRFASMGSGGAMGSTGFRNQLAREGSNLGTNIAALRGQMQQQGVNQQLGYAQQPFSNMMQLLTGALTPYNNVYQPPSGGFFGNIGAGLMSGAAQGYGQQWGQNMANPSQQQNPGIGGGNARPSFPGQSNLTY